MDVSSVSNQTIWDALQQMKQEMFSLIDGRMDNIQQMKQEMFSHIDTRMDTIQSSLQTIQGSMTTLGDHVSQLEQRVSCNEDNLTELQNQVKSLVGENNYLRDKLEEAENRSRAYNLRFLHVPEKSEGQNIHGFMKDLIPLLLGKENFPTLPVIEYAHRSPTTPPTKTDPKRGPPSPPRPIMVKLLSLQDKQLILQLAREKSALIYQDTEVLIYPDYSHGVLQKRKTFDDVKKKLRAKAMEYSLLFPATLRIIVDGKKVHFKNPRDAEAFIRGHEAHPRMSTDSS